MLFSSYRQSFNVMAIVVMVLCGLLVGSAMAQSSTSPPPPGKKSKAKQKKLPERESVTFVTKDSVEIHADFYGGMNEKETIPVLLLHDIGGTRAGLLPLAQHLQKKFGHAVLVPDLRGHGESVRVQGMQKEIDASKFKRTQLESIFEDLEQCKRFLMAKNNVGELNIDLLSVAAVGSTGIQTVRWVNRDWSWAPVAGEKQGQDVKAMVLISPVKRFKGLNISGDLKNPLITGKGQLPIPLMVTWGKSNKTAAKDGNSIVDQLKKSRPKVKEKIGDDGWWENETLFSVERKDSATGMKFVEKQIKGLQNDIGLFIENKVTAVKDDHRWQNRSRQTDEEGSGNSDEEGSGNADEEGSSSSGG